MDSWPREALALLNKTSIHIFKIDAFAEGHGKTAKFTVDRAYIECPLRRGKRLMREAT